MPRLFRVLIGLVLALALGAGTADAKPRTTTNVSVSYPRSVVAGTTIIITGRTKAVRATSVSVQRVQGRRWQRLASGRVRGKRFIVRVKLGPRVQVGTMRFRVTARRGSKTLARSKTHTISVQAPTVPGASTSAPIDDPGGRGSLGGDYPDADAVDCSRTFGIYSWCKRGTWLSSRGYGYRNCVDYAAWVLGLPRGMGNAKDWRANASKGGLTVTSSPSVGDVAWWGGGSFGHVAVVTAVYPSGAVDTVDYNGDGRGNKTIRSQTRADAYLHPRQPPAIIVSPGGGSNGGGQTSRPGEPPANRLAHELGFIRSNHGSGSTEIVAYHGSPNYTTLLHNGLTGYPATNDPANVKSLAIDVNGDGIDELGFIRFNHSSGQTELVVYHGSPGYQTLLHAGPTGYPAISDPQNVTPLAIDVNGDRIDELAFVRSNHGSGKTEVVIYHGSPHYTTLLHNGLTGYPAISDPQNVTPLAIDVNGDRIDELAFIRSNHGSGSTEIVAYHGSPNYTTLLHNGLTGYPATNDPANVKSLAIDVNGDGIDELGFIRFNHSSGQTELVVYHSSPGYQTLLHAGPTGYPAISDPQNVTPLAIQAN